jgi:hypothetical protein
MLTEQASAVDERSMRTVRDAGKSNEDGCREMDEDDET